MKKIILFYIVSILFSLNCLAVTLPLESMLCSRNDMDYMKLWHGFPKCRRNVPGWLKTDIYREYGIPDSQRHLYTIDHCIALSLSGSNHRDNLGPQRRSESTSRLEYQLYLKVKRGHMDVQDAIGILLDVKDNCTYIP